jgi:hypothetical protein
MDFGPCECWKPAETSKEAKAWKNPEKQAVSMVFNNIFPLYWKKISQNCFLSVAC